MDAQGFTAQEFIDYWTAPDDDGRSGLDYYEESLWEKTIEFDGEVARFGDAGPGAGLRLSLSRKYIANVKRQLARLQGGEYDV